jgi:NADH-quinone oxidoreductase subunit L
VNGLWLVVGPTVAALAGLAMGGRRRRLIAPIALLGSSVAVAMSLVALAGHPWSDPSVSFSSGDWWWIGPQVSIVDGLSASVALMVSVIALLVQVYSVAYLGREPRYSSYAAFVSLFTAAMLLVVVAGDLVSLVIGWEVMGLCSYVLIGQHWGDEAARRAAVKAFLVTKLGDVGFLIGVIVLIAWSQTIVIPDVVATAGVAGSRGILTAATLLLFMGVAGKSAQFPLHAWLPDAMAGPSPVSALIHAATMVAAGVYVVARLFPLFVTCPTTLTVMALVACVTMLGAALAALAQADLKRVLAWSTVSQLAYMVAALSVGARDAAVFHLLSHAFFKALLFLAAGAVIQAVGSQRLDDYGGLRTRMPVTAATMGLALASLAGIPVLSGFFSKESVIAAAQRAARGDAPVSSAVGWLVLTTAYATVLVTAAYVTRTWLRTFAGTYRGRRSPHDPVGLMRWPLIALAVPTVLFGFTGLAPQWLPTWTFPTTTTLVSRLGTGGVTAGHLIQVEALRPQWSTTLGALLLTLAGLLWMWRRWRARPSDDPFAASTPIRRAMASGLGMDVVYDRVAVRPFRAGVRAVTSFDSSTLEPLVRGTGELAERASSRLQEFQDGNVQRYLSGALTGVAVATVLVAVVIVSAVT